MKYIEAFLEWGGIKKDAVCLILSGAALVISIFDLIPLKKEIKAEVSGIYIVGARGLRAPLEKKTKKKGFFKRLLDKANPS